MTLQRVLEPEVMDSADDAAEYDAMDHTLVNQLFADDLLAAGSVSGDVLDLGTGTALIPIELCRRGDGFRIMAMDAAISMLEIARYNVEVAGFVERIQLAHVDAKRLPYADASFEIVMSNSIVHHIPQPIEVLREAVRVVVPGGRLFFRDLLRPADEAQLTRLVDTYADQASVRQRQLFGDSLRAALDLAEIRELVARLGYDPDSVAASSDRHWTWSTRK
jgi:ubiquinone/menaquinone biosynthesis C-methylase UbiE